MVEGEQNFEAVNLNSEISREELADLLAKAGIREKAQQTILADLEHPDTKSSDREWLKRQLERVIKNSVPAMTIELRRVVIKEWNIRLTNGLRS